MVFKHFNKRAEGYVDSGVKILIAVVIGALLLAGIYTLYSSTIMPTVNEKVEGLFDYSNNSGGNSSSSENKYHVLEAFNTNLEDIHDIVFFAVDIEVDNFSHMTVDGEVIERSNMGDIYEYDTGTTIILLGQSGKAALVGRKICSAIAIAILLN